MILILTTAFSFWSPCQVIQLNQQESFKLETRIDTFPVNDDTLSLPPAPPDLFSVDYIMGNFDPSTHPDFVVVDTPYANRTGLYLRKDTYDSFRLMYDHAAADGICLQIVSATRNFNSQKAIWEAKWTGRVLVDSIENVAETTPDPKERALKILKYSSMPGTSRHHWGTDIDLNSVENKWFEEGEGLDVFNWLRKHGPEHGFYQPYSAGRPYGYLEEPWHWSFMPVSDSLTEFAKNELTNEMITGFMGSETAELLNVVKYYVWGLMKMTNKNICEVQCNHTSDFY